MEPFLIIGSLTIMTSPLVRVTRTDEGCSSGVHPCGLTVVGRQL